MKDKLLYIADAIQRNCDFLSYTDPEDAADDLEFYVPLIRHLADDLRDLAETINETPGDTNHMIERPEPVQREFPEKHLFRRE